MSLEFKKKQTIFDKSQHLIFNQAKFIIGDDETEAQL